MSGKKILLLCIAYSVFTLLNMGIYSEFKSNQILAKENTKSSDNYTLNFQFDKKVVSMGDNNFTLTITSKKNPLSKDISIEIKPVMPEMPKMLVPPAKITSQGNGKFKGIIQFTMSGLWQVNIFLKQKGKVLSTKTFKYTVSE